MDFSLILIGLFIFASFAMFIYIKEVGAKDDELAQTKALFERVGIEITEKDSAVKQAATSFLEPLINWVNIRLKRAGITGPKVLARLATIQLVLIVLPAFILLTKASSLDIKVLIVVVILPFLPVAFVLVKQHQRQMRIKSQFPEMLDTLVRSLQSGYGIDAALNMIAQEFAAPLGSEIKEVSSQLQLGIGMREILREFQNRVSLIEAQYFVVAVIIQRETGGQLSVILEDLSKMMRRRERFTGKLKTLTSESRFTALFIGGAPVAYLAYKFLFAIETMTFFLEDPTGQFLLWGSVILIFTGIVILKMMMKIRF